MNLGQIVKTARKHWREGVLAVSIGVGSILYTGCSQGPSAQELINSSSTKIAEQIKVSGQETRDQIKSSEEANKKVSSPNLG